MNIETLRTLLEIINSNDPIGLIVHVVERKVVKGDNDESQEIESIFEADISDDLAEEFKKIFATTIKEKFFEDEDLIVTNISEANELINSAFYYDIDEFPEKLNVLKKFNPWLNYSKFSFSNDDIENVKAILITIGNQDSFFTIFKHVFPFTILRQSRIIGLVPSGDRFVKLESNILQLNTSIDFIYAQNNLIVNNIRILTNSYGYKEVIINQAKIKLELIENLGLIENIDELKTFALNAKYAKRILKINPDSPVLLLSKTRIIDFIINHNKLNRKISINHAESKIILDTDVSKILTIGILNDDFLKSNLTDLDYESERKLEFTSDQ